jgi:hypothetical protein
MVGDFYQEKWRPLENYIDRTQNQYTFTTGVSQEEFDKLKQEVKDMKELLKRAKIYDEQNNEPDCEIEGKIALLRDIAKVVGIDLDEVLKKKDGGTA